MTWTSRLSGARTAVAATVLLALVCTLVPMPAFAFWSVATTAGSAGTALAASVNAGATPVAAVATMNDITVDWADGTLSNGIPVSGYAVTRYSSANVPQTVLAGCTGTVTVSVCTETDVPDGLWTYAVTPRFASNWVGAESARSASVLADATTPVNNVSLVPVTGNSIKNGNTVFYRGAAAGSVQLSNAVTDTGSGPQSSVTGTLTGTTAGWSHSASRVSTPSGGPFLSAPFSWTAGTVSEPTVGVSGIDVYQNIAGTTIQFRRDDTPPTGGAISYANGTTRTTTVPVTLQSIADAGAGLGTGATYLQRSAATLSGDTCGAFGAFADRVTNPATSPSVQYDTTARGNCYQYRYRFTDSVGNQTVTTSPSVVKVKPTYSSVITNTTGISNYYRLNGAGTDIIDNEAFNDGTFFNAPTLRSLGAIADDTNAAVTFDGIDDYGRITRTIGTNFSIEFWFKSTQGLGTGTQWYNGAGLVDADFAGVANDFGVSLSSDGRVMAGVGSPDRTASSAAGFNDGAWHHVVMTRNQTTGVVTLYVDGVQRDSMTGGTQALTAPANIDFGRLQTGVQYYQGSLDEIALYSTALTAAQVQNHYFNALG